ncbi:MAG TPA: hypothetical protein VFV93_17965 [Thermomicrobiales bacterium]|nr:hypothetical protein [Thermomicrobiales bacterium]
MLAIVRVLGPHLFSVVGRFGFFIAAIGFSRYRRRLWRWFWE